MIKKALLLCLLFSTITLCDAQIENNIVRFETESLDINDICFSRSGKVIAITDNNEIKIFSTSTTGLMQEYSAGHSGKILCIDLAEDSAIMVSGSVDSTIVIWDVTTGDIVKKLTYQDAIITSVKISPDSRYLLSGGSDNSVVLYDILNDKLIKKYLDHTKDITAVCFDPNGNFFVTAGGDSKIRVYNLEELNLLAVLDKHKNWVRDIAMSADGRMLISCGDDAKVITWNISNVQNIFPLSIKKHRGSWITSVDFNYDASVYVVGNLAGQTTLMADYGQIVKKGKCLINQALFVPGYEKVFKIAIATRGDGVLLFNASDMELIKK